MHDDGRNEFDPLRIKLIQNDLVVISQTIQMIEVDNFWHLKTFQAVINNLWRRRDEVIHEQKDMPMHCTEMAESMMNWMEKKLLTCVVKVRPQPVNSMTEKKAQKKSGHNGNQNICKVGEQN